MGTVVSFDLRFTDEAKRSAMQAAVDDAVVWLHEVDDVFSTYRDDSQISRLGRGEIRLADCNDQVAEVLDLCAAVGRETDGYFSCTFGGRLDPTGLVKGWAVDRAGALLQAPVNIITTASSDHRIMGHCLSQVPATFPPRSVP